MGSKPKTPKPPPAPPTVQPNDVEIQAAQDQQKLKLRQMAGRASTLLTSPGSLSGVLPGLKTLLGQ